MQDKAPLPEKRDREGGCAPASTQVTGGSDSPLWRWSAGWRGVILCVLVGGGACLWRWNQSGAANLQEKRPQDEQAWVAQEQKWKVWMDNGDLASLRKFALSSPPDTLDGTVDYLVEHDSPRALQLLRGLCNDRDAAVTVAENAEELPVKDACTLCRYLIGNNDPEVRKVAICTLYFVAAKANGFKSPWPVGMGVPENRLETSRAEWERQVKNGLGEGFEEWVYKDTVAAYIYDGKATGQIADRTDDVKIDEAKLLAQLDAEFQKQFGIKLL